MKESFTLHITTNRNKYIQIILGFPIIRRWFFNYQCCKVTHITSPRKGKNLNYVVKIILTKFIWQCIFVRIIWTIISSSCVYKIKNWSLYWHKKYHLESTIDLFTIEYFVVSYLIQLVNLYQSIRENNIFVKF